MMPQIFDESLNFVGGVLGFLSLIMIPVVIYELGSFEIPSNMDMHVRGHLHHLFKHIQHRIHHMVSFIYGIFHAASDDVVMNAAVPSVSSRSCQCWANGAENEPFCEGKNWTVG